MKEITLNIFRQIFSLIPIDCQSFERISADGDKSFKFNRSPEWISLYYLKKERSPKLKEGYWIRNDKGEFKAEIFQGWKDNKTHWDSVDALPEFHDSFQSILNWALSEAPLQAEIFQSAKLETDKKLQKSLNLLEKKLKKIEFNDIKSLLDIVVSMSADDNSKLISEFKTLFSTPSSFLNPELNEYQLDHFFKAVFEMLSAKDYAVWVDWKDSESWDEKTKSLISKTSISIGENIWDAGNSTIEAKANRLREIIKKQGFDLVEITTGSDDYLFLVLNVNQTKQFESNWIQLQEKKLIPKKWKLK